MTSQISGRIYACYRLPNWWSWYRFEHFRGQGIKDFVKLLWHSRRLTFKFTSSNFVFHYVWHFLVTLTIIIILHYYYSKIFLNQVFVHSAFFKSSLFLAELTSVVTSTGRILNASLNSRMGVSGGGRGRGDFLAVIYSRLSSLSNDPIKSWVRMLSYCAAVSPETNEQYAIHEWDKIDLNEWLKHSVTCWWRRGMTESAA